MRRVVVGFSGGVTSAWSAGWALRTFPHDEVVLLFHDTKEEDADTYRFLREMSAALNHPITERSDGRSLSELFDDEGAMASSRMGFCSRILKAEQGDKFIKDLRVQGVDQIVRVFGFSANEWQRIQRFDAYAKKSGYEVIFPVAGQGVTKQQCAEWCQKEMGVRIPAMYAWSDHANCVGCVKGGKAYWLAVKENAPDVFEKRKQQERRFGHAMFKGYQTLGDLEHEGLKRVVGRREAIDLGPCECGD